MTPFADELLFDVTLTGILQAIVAVVLVAPVCLIGANYFRINLGRILTRYAMINLFFFAWSALGNFAWFRLTWGRIAVADDAPVWLPFIPFGRFLLNHAGGGPEFWHLIGDTSIARLQIFWVVTAIPVWLLTVVSMRVYLRIVESRLYGEVAR